VYQNGRADAHRCGSENTNRQEFVVWRYEELGTRIVLLCGEQSAEFNSLDIIDDQHPATSINSLSSLNTFRKCLYESSCKNKKPFFMTNEGVIGSKTNEGVIGSTKEKRVRYENGL